MNITPSLIYVGKLLACGIAFFVGMTVGGVLATGMGLQASALPPGAETNGVILRALLTAPILALAPAMLSPGLAGGWTIRMLILSFFTWIAYTVNTQLDAFLYIANYTGFWFSLVTYLIASLLCAVAVARLFPPSENAIDFVAAWQAFFARRRGQEWMWRLALAAVAFMPIYYLFGLLVFPFTSGYYQQNMYGLKAPGLDQIVPVLFLRSGLFLVACMPVIATWQRSERRLFLNLGLGLFILVGLVYLLTAYWMPLSVRLPHLLEILADEFVYAGVLVLLLAKRSPASTAEQVRAG